MASRNDGGENGSAISGVSSASATARGGIGGGISAGEDVA
jgi:hypothetical protein